MDCDPPQDSKPLMQVAADASKLTEDAELRENSLEDRLEWNGHIRQRPKIDTMLVAAQPGDFSKSKPTHIKEEWPHSMKRSLNEASNNKFTTVESHHSKKHESSPNSRPQSRRHDTYGNGTDTDSLATSPALSKFTIPVSQGSPGDTLPSLQNSPPQSAGSPNENLCLPSIHAQLGALADGSLPIESGVRPSSLNLKSHSSLFSSVNGSVGSPPKEFAPPRIPQYPSIHTRSNGSFLPGYPTNEPSPASTTSDTSPRESYRRGHEPTSMSPPGKYARHYSSNGMTPQSEVQTPLSAESHTTTSSYSTETSPNGDRMSIDKDRPILPPLTADGPISGGFKCDHEKCTAGPFQTQYLLNSHVNVHSQNRPHYCPVTACSRSEGGRGFKRKNEMIRHGLVHQSPGYICPYCPEREHKYPRPDNLQRHVRVHHPTKDKDDAQLREVLAQRLEGGNRGRRRRVGG
ncbi:hypothetical protein MMC19_003691 [Ptychographa xylographoides]|nr:hypothetical protein [Ptychographa xylographoides]